MSDTTKPRLGALGTRLGLIALVALVFGAAFGAGFGQRHVAENSTAGHMDHPGTDGVSLSDGTRFKIPVSSSQPQRGAADALVTIVEWCDLQGEACRQVDSVIPPLLAEYGGRLRHVWRHFAAQASQDSVISHEFARIAHEQAGKFWETRTLLLARTAPLTLEGLTPYVTALGMDANAVAASMAKHDHFGYVAADGLFAARFGVTTTPALFVNGRRLLGAVTHGRLQALIEEELVHANKVAANGVAKDKLYAEIVKDGMFDVKGLPTSQGPARAAP